MKDKKIFKILKQKEDCVLLVRYNIEHFLYKVRDIENDDIYIGTDYENALDVYEKFSLAEVRKARKEMFDSWLREYAEA